MIGTCDFCGEEFPMNELTDIGGDNYCPGCHPESDSDDGPDICGTCNGSGEGMYDGSACSACGGGGTVRLERGDESEIDAYIDRRDGE